VKAGGQRFNKVGSCHGDRGGVKTGLFKQSARRKAGQMFYSDELIKQG